MSLRITILTLSLALMTAFLYGQPSADDLVSGCVMSAGENATYLKDFRIQLPGATAGIQAPVHKANMYLMKNMKYRFSLCNTPGSDGNLYITFMTRGKNWFRHSIKAPVKATPLLTLYVTRQGSTASGMDL